MSKMAEIRKYYGVPAKRGMKVYCPDSMKECVITGTPRSGMYLNIRGPYGFKRTYHPYDLNYVLADGTFIKSAELKKAHDARWDAFNGQLNKSS